MKKNLFAVMAVLALAGALMLTACGTKAATQEKETQAEASAEARPEYKAEKKAIEGGYFANEYEEEIDGQVTKRADYIILLEDYTGFYSAQDIIDLTWNQDEIKRADGVTMKLKAGENDGIIVTDGGQDIEFKRFTGDLPQELEQKIIDALGSRDYAGSYENSVTKDTIALAKNNSGTYDVELHLTGLGDLKGDGNNVDGAVEIGFTTSDGKKLYSVFFPDGNQFILRVTQSEWDKVREQTDFAGFEKK